MELISRALKLRIYPTQEQEQYIKNCLGASRFLYNQMLNERKIAYEELKDDKEKLYKYEYKTAKEYKQEFDFLKEVDSHSLMWAKLNLSNAYSNFFKSLKGVRKGEQVGFPKFKSKHSHSDSYTSSMGLKIDFDKQELQMLKIKHLRFKNTKNYKSWYRQETTILKHLTIRQVPSGKYFASLLFEGEKDYSDTKKEIKKITGLDCSMQNFFVDEQGNSPVFNRNYRDFEEKLAKEQQKLSRKTRGSKNWEKQRIKVARTHERIANKRRDFIDQLSWKLVQENDCIVVENLNLKGMSQSLNLGKSVMDLGYSSFVAKLKYKCEWNEKTLIMADRWFASSKTCHACGFVKKDLLLHEREWTCPNCGTKLHRDQNAAINLVNLVKTPQELREAPFENSESIAASSKEYPAL